MTGNLNALITGANRGIGFAVAKRLGQQKFKIWLACRDKERGDKAAMELSLEGIEAEAVIMDVTSSGSIRSAVEFLQARVSQLDVLVNSAGIHFGLPPQISEESVDDIRAIFETNAFGPVMVTQALLPLLRKSESARIVMVSSGLGSHALTTDISSENWGVGFAGYAASKSALNMFTLKFAKELLNDGIKVNAVDPGLTATDLGGPFARRTPDEASEIIVKLATLDRFGPTGGFYRDGRLAMDMDTSPW